MPKLRRLVAEEVKVRREARVVEHVVRVSADGEDLARLHEVVVVESPAVGVALNRTLVENRGSSCTKCPCPRSVTRTCGAGAFRAT